MLDTAIAEHNLHTQSAKRNDSKENACGSSTAYEALQECSYPFSLGGIIRVNPLNPRCKKATP